MWSNRMNITQLVNSKTNTQPCDCGSHIVYGNVYIFPIILSDAVLT